MELGAVGQSQQVRRGALPGSVPPPSPAIGEQPAAVESFVSSENPPSTSAQPTPEVVPTPCSSRHLNTIVVGGGVGGLYTAWRLTGADGSEPTAAPESVGVFERSKRLGGRIDSVSPPGMPDIKAEFGGMRYHESQRLITSLVDKLKLPSEFFQVNGKGALAYLKGQRVPAADIGSLGKAYGVPESEQGKSPAQLWGEAIKSVVPHADTLSRADWRSVQKDGAEMVIDPETGQEKVVPFFQLGMSEAVSPGLSEAGKNFVRDGIGYDHFVANTTNAATMMEAQMEHFATDAPFRTLSNGMSEIPSTLARQFEEKGGSIHQGFDLESFDYDQNSKTWVVQFRTEQGTETYTADNLVLAMPRKAIERVAEHTPLLARPEVKPLLETVTPYPSMKILLAYSDDWWKQRGIEGGRTVSDTDLRQTYYLGSETDKEAGKTGNHNSLLLAGYSNGRGMKNWEKLLPANHYAGAPGEDATGENRWKQHEIPREMLQEVVRQIREIHGDNTIPMPYSAVAQVWKGEIYGGAVNYWNKGVDASKASQAVLSPLQGLKGYENASFYIVGEAYSWSQQEGAQQGWVEGALQTAESALERRGKEAPAWVLPTQE